MPSASTEKAIVSLERTGVSGRLQQHTDLWIQQPRVESVVLTGNGATGRSIPLIDLGLTILPWEDTTPRLECLDRFASESVMC